MDEEKQELLKEKMVANSSKNSWTSADTMVANSSQNEEGKSKKVWSNKMYWSCPLGYLKDPCIA